MSAQTATYRNVSEATFAGLERLFTRGKVLNVRGHEIREIRNNILVLSRPCERCLFVPNRRNNVFISIAETMWVLAGRNDIGWLKAYLPSVGDYSDDGNTWRAGYGPRLRHWQGVDQLEKVVELLLAEQATRRAAMSLYDPGSDFIDSKDVPCNNWLHWLIRDGKLHLNVALRSNDIIWGFSGINCFEWSVLQEMMAFWANAEPGEATFFASSFHIYKRHYDRADAILKNFRGVYCYDFRLSPPRFCTGFDHFDRSMQQWFELEEAIRKSPGTPPSISGFLGDPFLLATLNMVRLYHGAGSGWTVSRIGDELAAMPPDDFTAAAYEHFSRKHPELIKAVSHPDIAEFLAAYLNSSTSRAEPKNIENLKSKIKALHFEKNAAYGNSWKRRGELISILANIARKVDRLERYDLTAITLNDESTLDTALDLLVYVIKYQLFLLEKIDGKGRDLLPPDAKRPYSDHTGNFDWRLDQMKSTKAILNASTLTREIASEFERLNALAIDQNSTPNERLICASKLGDLAFSLLLAFNEGKGSQI